MENENMALNEQVEVVNDLPATPVDEQQATEEPIEQESTSTDEETTAVGETESEREPKKGYSSRIRELNTRAKEAETYAKSLEARLAELTGKADSGDGYEPMPVNDDPIVKDGEEIDISELDRRIRAREARLLQQVDTMSRLRERQQEAVNRINSEATEVMRKYPELDPSSDHYNSELSEAIAEATEAYVKNAPYTASVKSYVDKMMRPYKGAVSKEVGNMTKQVAKQVSETALRPTSVRGNERSAEEKSIAELERELGIVQA